MNVLRLASRTVSRSFPMIEKSSTFNQIAIARAVPLRTFCSESYEDISIKGTKSHGSLKSAFMAKSMAALRYEYYAQKADIEGFTDAALAFRQVAESAKQQAFGHMEFLEEAGDPATDNEIGDTLTNLEGCVAAEMEEAERIVPEWANTAHKDGITDVEEWFEMLSTTALRNAGRLQMSLERAKEELGAERNNN